MPNPIGDGPVTLPNRTIYLRRRPASKPDLVLSGGAGGVQTFYEMSGSSDGTSLPVDAGGYVEITPTCNPAPSDTMNVTQGNNRFMANIAVTGTNWNPNPILLKLVLNVVGSPHCTLEWAASKEQLGETNNLYWTGVLFPLLYPPEDEDYPIEFTCGAGGSGLISPMLDGNGHPVAGGNVLTMSPPVIVSYWSNHNDAANGIPAGIPGSFSGYATVTQFAPTTETDVYFSLVQTFFNSSYSSMSGSISGLL